MTTNPKRPRQSFKKYPMKRAGAAQIFSREESFKWMIFRKFIGEKGKTVRKCVERKYAVTWFITAC